MLHLASRTRIDAGMFEGAKDKAEEGQERKGAERVRRESRGVGGGKTSVDLVASDFLGIAKVKSSLMTGTDGWYGYGIPSRVKVPRYHVISDPRREPSSSQARRPGLRPQLRCQYRCRASSLPGSVPCRRHRAPLWPKAVGL